MDIGVGETNCYQKQGLISYVIFFSTAPDFQLNLFLSNGKYVDQEIYYRPQDFKTGITLNILDYILQIKKLPQWAAKQ